MKSKFLRKKRVPKDVNVEIIRKNVKPRLVFGCETWGTTVRQRSKIMGMEMRFLRKIEW